MINFGVLSGWIGVGFCLIALEMLLPQYTLAVGSMLLGAGVGMILIPIAEKKKLFGFGDD